MRRIVVIGGGISGLATAWRAAARVREVEDDLEVVVLEKEKEVGGKAVTVVEDGWLVELGPTGFLDNEPVLDRLIQEAGMEHEKIPAEEAAARRFIVRNRRMREVPLHPLSFARSGLLGARGVLRLAMEPFVRKRGDESDESVWDFARRRIGTEAADRLIAPMTLGVFAGDARRLSLPAAFPRMAALEREYGSLVRGMIALRRKRKDGRETGGPAGPGGGLFSFRGGLQSFARTLADRGDFEVRSGSEVETLLFDRQGGWKVVVKGDTETLPADVVVLAGEPWAMAAVVRETIPELAKLLAGIYCPPVSVVALGFDEEAAAGVPRGFGVLIPRGDCYRMLGCLWDTHLFPGRSPQKKLLLRAMMGGSVDPEVGELTDDELVTCVRDDLKRLLRIHAAPVYRRVVTWPRAIPQYELGHLARVRAIEATVAERPGLFMAGNALHGISFAKAAAVGLAAGEEAVRYLSREHGRLSGEVLPH